MSINTFESEPEPDPDPDPEPEPTPTGPGFSKVEIFNCHTDRREVHVWVNDSTARSGWKEVGVHESQYNGAGLCPSGEPFVVDLKDKHVYEIACVDVGGIACGANDPTSEGCRRQYVIVLGTSAGAAVPVQVL